MTRNWVPAAAWFIAALLPVAASFAQQNVGSDDNSSAQQTSGLRTALQDTEQYFTSPIRWDAEDWTNFGISLAAIAAAHSFDSRVRTAIAGPNAPLNGGKDMNSARDAIPAAGLIVGDWATAAYLGDPDGYSETWRLVEAGAFSTVTAEGLALATGRVRPDGTTSPNEWRKGGDSFPSVHTSAAFAIGITFAESGSDEYRWVRRILGYAVAGGTAYIRMKDNLHWLSDTVAGAALGAATARFVLDREYGPGPHFSFMPQKGGFMVSYNVPLH